MTLRRFGVLALVMVALLVTACRQSETAESLEQVTNPTAVIPAPTATPEDVSVTQLPGAVTTGQEAFTIPTSGRIETGTPVVIGVGNPVGLSPDGSAVITTAAHPGGFLSCEASPAEAFWLVPLDGSPRRLLSEHQIHSAGLDSFSTHDGKALWMQWCDGFPIGPYVASISDPGELSDIELIELPYEPGNELGNPRWLDDGTIEVALSGQGIATMLIVDPSSGSVTRSREVPLNEAFPQPKPWQWDAVTERWAVPLTSGAELAIPGLPSDHNDFRTPVVHPTMPIAFLPMPSETPEWIQVVAVPLSDDLEIASGVAPTTPLVGSWATQTETLLALRDGESWLMQRLDPVDDCVADLFIRSLSGVDQPIDSGLALGTLSNPLAAGDTAMFTSGCTRGPQSLIWASLDLDGTNGPELAIESIAKMPFATTTYFWGFEVRDDRLEAAFGDYRLDTIVTLDRDGILQASSTGDEGYGPRVRDPLCEISTPFPSGWSINIAGGGAGGMQLRHPSGANVLAFCRQDDVLAEFSIDPRTNPQASPSEAVDVGTYDVESWNSPRETLNGMRWRLATAANGQPGRSSVLEVNAGDRTVYALADAPGAAGLDPDLVGAMSEILSGMQVGSIQG